MAEIQNVNLRNILYLYQAICGFGKTFAKIEEFVNNLKLNGIFLTENKHQNRAIAEELTNFGFIEDIDFIVWKAILCLADNGKYIGLCKKFNHDKDIEMLVRKGVNASNVCRVCKYKDKKAKIDPPTYDSCPFIAQFEARPRIIIADVHYINTKYISDIHGYELILDDSCTKKVDLPSKQDFKTYFSQVNEYRKDTYNLSDFGDTSPPDTHDYFADFVNECVNNPKYTQDKIRAITQEQVDIFIHYLEKGETIPQGFFVNLFGIKDWIDTWQMSQNYESWKVSILKKAKDICLDRDRWNTIQYAKNLDKQMIDPDYKLNTGIETYTISILDARMPKRLIDIHFKDNYCDIIEKHPDDTTCQTKVVYRVGEKPLGHQFLKFDISPNGKKRYLGIIQAVAKHAYPDRNTRDVTLCLTVHKSEAIAYRNILSLYFKEVVILTYGKTKGLNLAIGKDLYILLGTYTIKPKNLFEEFRYDYLKEPSTTESVWNSDLGRVYKDPELNDLNQRLSGYEQYQSFHRGRPYRYDIKLYCIGTVPEIAQDEFEIKQLYAHKTENGQSYVVDDIRAEIDHRAIYIRSQIPNAKEIIVKQIMVKFDLKQAMAYRVLDRFLDITESEFIEVKRDDLRLKPVYIEYTNEYELRQSMLEPQEELYYG
jgi:hypothetical protein